MLTLALIKENPEDVIKRLAVKHFDGREMIEKILELDKQRRAAQTQFDNNACSLKQLASQIGALMKEGKKVGKKMVFSNRTYDILKWVALVGTNAFSALIITLGKIWGWSYAEAIAGTISAIGTCIGACLQVSSANYNKGE